MRNLIKTTIATAAIAILGACSSVSIIPQEKIVARSDGLTETPKWASYGVGSYSEKGSVIFVGNHEASTGSSLSMACRVASTKAKNEIANEIQQKLSYVLQHAEEGMSIGGGQTKYIGGEVSKLTTSAVRYDGCYWEQVAIPSGYDSYNFVYRVFSKVSIPKDKLEEAIRKAGKGKFSEEFTKQVADHWEDLVSGETN